METAIKSLHKNLKVLKIEQEEEIKELQSKFGKEKINLNTLHEDLQKQIKVKKIHLELLISSAKEKLKSTSKFSDAKHQEREKNLDLLFKNLPTASEEFIKDLEDIKQGLSKKLTAEEINNLYQTQNDLKNLQSQQTVQILQTQPYGTPSSSK